MLLSSVRGEERAGDEEIDDKRQDIHDGREHRLRKQRRVFFDRRGAKRQQCADGFGDDDGEEHRGSDEPREWECVGEKLKIPAIPGPNALTRQIHKHISGDIFDRSDVDDAGILLDDDPKESERSGEGGDDQSGLEFFEPNLQNLFRRDRIQCERADHKTSGLAARVAARIHKGRDEGDENAEAREDRSIL